MSRCTSSNVLATLSAPVTPNAASAVKLFSGRVAISAHRVRAAGSKRSILLRSASTGGMSIGAVTGPGVSGPEAGDGALAAGGAWRTVAGSVLHARI